MPSTVCLRIVESSDGTALFSCVGGISETFEAPSYFQHRLSSSTSTSTETPFSGMELCSQSSTGGKNSQGAMLDIASSQSISKASYDEPLTMDITPTTGSYSESAMIDSIHESSISSMATPLQIKRSIPDVLHPLRGLYVSCEQRWEELEDTLFILLHGQMNYLDILRDLYNRGVQSSLLLQSIAYLSTHRQRRRCESTYFEHISTLATFLSVGRTRRDKKLAVVRTLMTCLSPPDPSWECQDDTIDATLDFITHRSNMDWDLLDPADAMLMWELRAMSQCLLDREQARLARVTKTADTAVIAISAGAILVGEGMTRSGAVLSCHIEKAAKQAKNRIKANESPLIMDRDAVVALTYADTAKRASIHAKQSTKLVMDRVREASRCGFQMATNMLEESLVAECIPPEGREALRAAGKIGLAIVGAGSIVGEALVETTRSVMEKATVVGADIVHHKYGASAGKVASDTGEIAVNLMRTVGNISTLSEGTTLATTVAQDTAKHQSMLEVEKAKNLLKQFEAQAISFLKMSVKNSDRGMAGGNISAPIPHSSQSTLEHVPTLHTRGTASVERSPWKSGDDGTIPDLIQNHSMGSESIETTSDNTSTDDEMLLRHRS